MKPEREAMLHPAEALLGREPVFRMDFHLLFKHATARCKYALYRKTAFLQ